MSPRYAILVLIAFLTFLPGQNLIAEPSQPAAPVRTDHYGDPLPKGARFRLGTVRLRHDGDVTALAWLPDGHTLASASWDSTVRLWQIPGGKQLAKWDNLGGVVFAPDGRTLACGEGNKKFGPPGDRPIRLVDVTSGKELRCIRVPENAATLFNLTPGHPLGFYSPDGKILAVRETRSGVHVYAVDSGRELGHLQAEVLDFGHPVVFAPDSRSVLVATNKGVIRWTISTHTKDRILADDKRTAFSLAFSPDGKTLAAVVDHQTVTLRSWPAGKELRRLQLKETDVTGSMVLAFSSDGKLLAVSELVSISLWNTATGEKVRQFKGLRDKAWDLAFSPDGSLLAAAGRDSVVTVWEVHAVKSPRPLTGVGHLLELVGLAADGQTLLTRSAEGALMIWDARKGCRLRMLAEGPDSIDDFLFGPDATRKRAALRLEMEKRQNSPGSLQERFSHYSHTAFSPDGSMLAVGSVVDGKIFLLLKSDKDIEYRSLDDDNSVKEARERRVTIAVRQLRFSPDGLTLAATYNDDRLILWNLRNRRARHTLSFPTHGESYRYLEFSPDSRLVALSDRHALYLVETASGQRFRERILGKNWIDSLAFAPDNRALALGDAGSRAAILLWDLPTDKDVQCLRGHLDSVLKLIFSPDCTFLLSSGFDNSVLSWDVASILRRRQSGKDLSRAKLSELWNDLSSKDATRAQRAVAEMIQAPDSALPFLEKSLPPVAPAEMARIAALIADLDHEQFARRERASKDLANLAESAVPSLRKVLQEKPTLEKRQRIALVLELIEGRGISPAWLRTIRALQVVETIGTPQARRVLEGLATGAGDATLTHEAKTALQRLDRRNVNP